MNTKLKNAIGGGFVFGAVLFGSADVYAANPEMKPLQMIHDELLANFTPVEQWGESAPGSINHSGDVPFTGDCDDFYVAAFNQLQAWAYKPFAMLVQTKGARAARAGHVMACVKVNGRTRCLDNRNAKVLRPTQIRDQYKVERRVYPKNYSGEK